MMARRLLRSLDRRMTQWRGETSVACGGLTGRFGVANKAEYKHVRGGLFERDVLARFLAALRPDDVVYEVGGHIGSWSVFIAQRVVNGSLYVFEPNAHNAAVNRANLTRNGLGRVRVVEAAAGDREGTATLHVGADAAAGLHSLVRQTEGGRSVDVPVRRLDRFAAEPDVRPPTALKIDCEGAEGRVLDGLGVQLECVRTLMLEAHGETLRAAGSTKAAVLKGVADAGLVPLHVWPGDDVSRHLFTRGGSI